MQIDVIYVKLWLRWVRVKLVKQFSSLVLPSPAPLPIIDVTFIIGFPLNVVHGGARPANCCVLSIICMCHYIYLGLYIYRYKSATTLKAKNYEKNSKRFFLFPPMIFFIILVPVVLVHTASLVWTLIKLWSLENCF